MKKKSEIDILVSGASVAGLTTAYWLIRHGFRVTVVERAPRLRPGGQALDVRGPALEVAKRMGILPKLQEHSTRLNGMSVEDAVGNELFRSTERSLTGGQFNSPDVEILRDDLCKVLFEAAGARVKFLFDDRITSITQKEAVADIAFANAPPHRFDLVIGADGLYSGVRRLAFGPDEQFLRYVGQNIAVFSVPNFLGLDHWQVMCMDGDVGGLMLATDKDAHARMYLGFSTTEPLDYDYRDIAAQKRLMADRFADAGWKFPEILAYMQDSPDFYFYATHMVQMNEWSRGRVALVGDAGYCVSPASGQGTTIAMVAACVLAGELAAHTNDLLAGVRNYEHEIRDYVTKSQELALKSISDQALMTQPDDVPDFGKMALPFAIKDYSGFDH